MAVAEKAAIIKAILNTMIDRYIFASFWFGGFTESMVYLIPIMDANINQLLLLEKSFIWYWADNRAADWQDLKLFCDTP
jgi:citrate lyase alpha subunit